MDFLSKFGYKILIIFFIAFILVWIFFSFSWLLFLIFLGLIFIYRNPRRILICKDLKAVLCPIDGKIENISTINHQDLGECIELSIENAFYNVGTIRSCMDMSVETLKIRHGFFINSRAFKNLNERLFIIAKTKDERSIGIRICAGCLDAKLKVDEDLNELKAGQEFGFSLNSNISLLLPKDTRLIVAVGDELKACSLIGYLS